jgi:hypothetical protein
MSTNSSRRLVATAALVLALGAMATPAVAVPEKGDPVPTTTTNHCSLERVGTQYVRCDDLTGNGVPAATFIPERA